MTAMPQLVALLHSFVGLTAVLVAVGTYYDRAVLGSPDPMLMTELFIGAFIGAITFTGSLVAFGKLQALLSSKPLVFKGQHQVNLVVSLVAVTCGIEFVMHDNLLALFIMLALALLLGILLIVPIGGADMPVVVSMLNSYSGWAATATGFTLENNLLIITGALVGFSGAILSYIMSRAMNRSIVSIILGGFGGGGGSDQAVAVAADRRVKTASVEDAVFLMANASKVIIAPGYGMAVAQAQHALKELMDLLESKGVNIRFAIHPVAGRMPGHMNVLLAEADVPYDHVFEMDEINPEFSTADVVIVVGANDVTNPAAKSEKSSPIYGMPILDVYKARQVFFIKRSMSPGYSGVDNLLFYQDNCALIFGDAKKVCENMATELRSV
jgi:NAD(P) transhydrogenase subunit beta